MQLVDFIKKHEDMFFPKTALNNKVFSEIWTERLLQPPPEIHQISSWFFGGFLRFSNNRTCRFFPPVAIIDENPIQYQSMNDRYQLDKIPLSNIVESSNLRNVILPLAELTTIEIIIAITTINDSNEQIDTKYTIWNSVDLTLTPPTTLLDTLILVSQ